jgi:hypothetical protein
LDRYEDVENARENCDEVPAARRADAEREQRSATI